ncbi:MAG: hypothetical protein QXJ75_05595 [Candidatus Bathyarchaeia archaeon]
MLSPLKSRRLTLKGFALYEYDWRGLVALTALIGYITLLVLRAPNVDALGFGVGLAMGWYFREKSSDRQPWLIERPLKIPRATERHPIFKPLKSKLIKALEALGNYNPACDDVIVAEMVKTLIDIRTVDRKIEELEDLRGLQTAFKAKAMLLEMLSKLSAELAISRRYRLTRGQVAELKEGLEHQLKELLVQN